MKHHQDYEYFCEKKHPEGGYYLMTLHDWVFCKMDVREDGQELVEVTDEGALWEFVKI